MAFGDHQSPVQISDILCGQRESGVATFGTPGTCVGDNIGEIEGMLREWRGAS